MNNKAFKNNKFVHINEYYPKLQNPQKYNGDRPITIRSSYELRFCKWLDLNESVVCWSSETLVIPYTFEGNPHRYYPDFVVENKRGQKMMIEVKPSRQIKKPVRKKRKTKRYIYDCLTYVKNRCKWKAAKEYCDKNDMEFKFITENELKKY